jgi:outer membrane protein assembly factor BamA
MSNRLMLCLVWGLCLGLLVLGAGQAWAGRTVNPPPAINMDVGQEKPTPEAMALPYAFKTDTLDWAGGVAAGASGYIQDQAGLFAAVMGSTNSSKGIYFVGWNFQAPFWKRLFMDYNLSWGDYSKQRIYIDGNPGYTNNTAGGNDSKSSDYLEGSGEDNWVEFRFRYVFPWGASAQAPINKYFLKKGILASKPSGGDVWNPFTSGITTLEARTFWRERTLELPEAQPINKTNGVELNLIYNNTDFPTNPSRGSIQRLAVTRDFGLWESSQTWTTVEIEASKYFTLSSNSKWFKQSVLALNVWTIDTPSWEEKDGRNESRPPPYLGATLGGFWRMRGFPQGRFNDQAAVYYCAEWRVIPQWQPLPEISWLRFFKIDWWQFVGFAEAGRVADDWSLDELHSDMKWDVGVGLRLMAIKSVVRLDLAYSDEGVGIWAMVGHPF